MTRDELFAIANEGNVRAFLAVIRACEGTAGPDGYSTLYGYEKFDSFDDHPRRKVSKGAYTSSAAGAYQIIEPTWDWIRQAHPTITTFTPESQDAAAVALLIRRRALDAIRAGNLEAAVAATAGEWASLPGSPYGQPRRTMEYVRRVFAENGGREPGSAAPIENRTQPPTIGVRPEPVINAAPARQDAPQRPAEGQPMSPFILPALDALVGLLPTLSKLFKGEAPSAVAERNAAAVEAIASKVLPIVQQAVGAPNTQATVEAIQSAPELAKKADESLRLSYADLHELSERSLVSARKFVMDYGANTNVRTVAGRFTFPELLSLVFIGLASAGVGYLMYTKQLTGELLGGVVTLMLIGGWTEIRKFWFGLGAPESERAKRES